MKRSIKAKMITIALLSALLAAGCSSNTTNTSSSASSTIPADVSAEQSSGDASAADLQLTSLDAEEQADFDDDDELTTWSADSSTAIALSGSSASINGAGATVEGGIVTITAAGTYVVSGTLSNGQIVVEAPEDAVVHLVLNGVQLSNDDGSAIHVKEADKTIVTLQDGTNNVVSDGETYADTSEEAPSAAIFSKGDLTINGTGKLTVQGSANDGISSKDDLKMMSGTIDVKAADDGLIGRELVAVKDGTITVNAGGDGVKATDDTEAAEKGYVAITGGTFNITSVNDGIQAASSILIGGGTFDIVTGGGSAASTKTHQDNGPRGFDNQPQEETVADDTESSSAKALKATGDIAITNGDFQIDSADDAIHSNANIAIMGGKYSVTSGDDGIHADTSLSISNGTIQVSKSYEGLESADIAISGGEIHVVTSDDGVNVGGGNDGSGSGNGTTNGMLSISGGYIYVDSMGDGLDSNGSMVMSGGTAIVNGPTENNNGPLDYNGTFEQSGGTLIAAGSAGMAQAPSDDSSQRAVMMTFPGTLEAGTLVTLTDSSGTAVASFQPAKTFSSIVISSPDLKSGEEYTISTGGSASGSATDGRYEGGSSSGSTKVITFKLGEKVTYVNESGLTTANSGGGFGGGRGPRMR
jgi:hypothetical protein